MPELDTELHMDMYRFGRRSRSLLSRTKRAIKVLLGTDDVYGLEWGDPESLPPLQYVREHYLQPYVTQDAHIVELGPGGGRWTRYMLPAKRIYAVDYHQELLNELKSNIKSRNMTFLKNNGFDFPGIQPGSIDFIFSFGTFVHLELDIIDHYLQNIKSIIKTNSNVVIHYSDKTKPLGKQIQEFSENDPEKMRELVLSHGYTIFEEDVKTLWHSSIIRFGLAHDKH